MKSGWFIEDISAACYADYGFLSCRDDAPEWIAASSVKKCLEQILMNEDRRSVRRKELLGAKKLHEFSVME